ncbi:MAG: hypothetical protein RL194_1043 [Pseudomonadota bacterium]
MKKVLIIAAALVASTAAQAASVTTSVSASKIENMIVENCKGPVNVQGRVITCRQEASFGASLLMQMGYTGTYGSTTEEVYQITLTPVKGGTRISARGWFEGSNGFGARSRVMVNDDRMQEMLDQAWSKR